MSDNIAKVKNKEQHRIADYDRSSQTLWIKHGDCLTAIRILPDGQLEVDGKVVI